MSNALQVIIGQGKTYVESIKAAVGRYNEETTRKVFHHVEHLAEYDENGVSIKMTIIWYTAFVEDEPKKDQFEYIGSIDVDPNDPNWREKMFSQQRDKPISTKHTWDTDQVLFPKDHNQSD